VHNKETGNKKLNDSHFKSITEEIITNQHKIKDGNIEEFFKYNNLDCSGPLSTLERKSSTHLMNCIDLSRFHESTTTDCAHVRQYVEILREEDKLQTLLDTIVSLCSNERSVKKVVVFAHRSNTARLVEFLIANLKNSITNNCPVISGVLSNSDEIACNRVMTAFRNSNNNILIIFDEVFRNSALGE
jgi:superfamily II DNA/RNA helicase